MKEFPEIFNEQIKTMDGEEFHISLTDDAKPFCVNTPRSVPFAYRDKHRAMLTVLQTQGTIEPVTEPTEWCAPIVVTPKKDTEGIRMCVDLSRLNKYVRRERYQSPTPAEAVADIAADKAKVFTKIDAMKAYHQCPLDNKSQLLTTFITPFGWFKFLRAPYGISSISEHYNCQMDKAFAGLSGFCRVVDNVIYDSNATHHPDYVKQFNAVPIIIKPVTEPTEWCAPIVVTPKKDTETRQKSSQNDSNATFALMPISQHDRAPIPAGTALDSSCNRRQTMILIQAGSRFLTDAESRYAIIELELLAISWTIIKCKMFLADLPHFRVITDHHPLIPILNSHRLDEIENPRLQRLDPNHCLQFHSRMVQRKGEQRFRHSLMQPCT